MESIFPIILNSKMGFNNFENQNNNNVNLRTNANSNNNNFLNNLQNNFNNQNKNSNSVDLSKLSYQCEEIGCEWCDKANTRNCKQCKNGFFMYMGKCYAICPKEYVADIYTRTCNVLDNTSK